MANGKHVKQRIKYNIFLNKISLRTNSIFRFYPSMNLSRSKLAGFTDSINKI